jgi:coenzyme F420-reducing hydrogenase alpha subunit
MDQTRTIRIEALARIEGEGGLTLSVRDGQIDDVQLRIFEPPRLFEAFLRGRRLEEAPDITARICGICPVAYQMSSVHALEAALGLQTTGTIRQLRRLLYCGEWIESHALHIHLLHAPDFLGCDSVVPLAKRFPTETQRGLRLKKIGNRLLEVLGGRAIHPVNAAVGGFYRLPRRAELSVLAADLRWGLAASSDVARWVAGFEFPDFEQDYCFVSVVNPDEYPMCAGDIGASDGVRIPASDFERHFRERHERRSTALHARRLPTGRAYLTGPLARFNLCREQLSPAARGLADELGLELPCRNPFKMIIVRAIEMAHAFEEALEIIDSHAPNGPARVPYQHRRSHGAAATEAPRGLLYHRYVVDERGLIESANIVPPTSQNQSQIEHDLGAFLRDKVAQDNGAIAAASERLVRSYDPCISCSTHALRVHVDRCV